MKKRIAIYSRTLSFWGGSFQYAKAFVQALADLDREKYEIRVWHDKDDDWSEVCKGKDFREYIIGDYEIPAQMKPAAQKILQKISTLPEEAEAQCKELLAPLRPFSTEAQLDSWDPQIVICPQMGCPHFHRGARHIGVIHDLMHRYESKFPEVGTPMEIAAREHLFQDLIRNCDTIIVDSKTGMQHVLESYPYARQEQIKILPFTAFSEITEAVPLKPAFELPAKFLFYPAQFWLHKNHAELARAIAILKREFPDIAVVAAGNMKQNGFETFRRIVESEGLEKNFILPGYISSQEIAWLYRHARAFVMPTFFGPTNIPPLEAMAFGCPVAVSGIYDMPKQCGDAALYFKPDDVKSIAKVLHKLWTDDALCENLADKGLKRSRLYGIRAFNRQVCRIVEEIASSIEL